MPKNNVELQIFGQSLRLNCPEDQQQALLTAARKLEDRVAQMKNQSGIIQLEKVLAIIALNLNFELEQEKAKVQQNTDVLSSFVDRLDASLSNLKDSAGLLLDNVKDNEEKTPLLDPQD